jgi:hypothetical protein
MESISSIALQGNALNGSLPSNWSSLQGLESLLLGDNLIQASWSSAWMAPPVICCMPLSAAASRSRAARRSQPGGCLSVELGACGPESAVCCRKPAYEQAQAPAASCRRVRCPRPGPRCAT